MLRKIHNHGLKKLKDWPNKRINQVLPVKILKSSCRFRQEFFCYLEKTLKLGSFKVKLFATKTQNHKDSQNQTINIFKFAQQLN